ncbi:MAG: hypothetical protein IPK62_15435 [Bacteroidetes bacterium]|jgi:hypothetical protein|nr:hypothetical protein [Bacteroidota bacterium]MBK8146269.1 hypothetical protein [Bacteroidota bacterium]
MSRNRREILQNYNGGFFREEDYCRISILFENYRLRCAQSNCSELIDLHNYTIKKDPIRIKRELVNKKKRPFLFVNCLN